MDLVKAYGKIASLGGLPREVKLLRRRYPGEFTQGRTAGQTRITAILDDPYEEQTASPFPEDIEKRIKWGYPEGETAASDWYRAEWSKGEVPPDSGAVEAYTWGFIKGWTDFLIQNPGAQSNSYVALARSMVLAIGEPNARELFGILTGPDADRATRLVEMAKTIDGIEGHGSMALWSGLVEGLGLRRPDQPKYAKALALLGLGQPASIDGNDQSPGHVEAPQPAPSLPVPVSSEFKICPDCAELVRHAARKCRFCGYMFEPVQGAV